MDPSIVKTICVTGAVVLAVVVLPIVVLMLEHQRKMARLLRGDKVEESDSQIGIIMGVKPNEDTKALVERVAKLESQVQDLQAALITRPSAPVESSVRELLA